jgi:Glycosyltransferase family 87
VTVSAAATLRRPSRRTALVAAVAAATFGVAWAILHVGFYERAQLPDTPIYRRYGEAITDGNIPYRDFRVEYPPGALPMFVLPALVSRRGDQTRYGRVFDILMAACGALVAGFTASALLGRGLSRTRLRFGLALVALSPLLLGSVLRSRFDLWPTAVFAAALLAIVARRWRLSSALLGLGAVVKVYPIVAAPLLLAHVWRHFGRREAAACAAWLVGAAAVVAMPFIAIAPRGVWDSLTGQTTRPLQIESLGSGILLAAHHLAGIDLTMRSSHGSQNLIGTTPDIVAAAQSAMMIVMLLGLWAVFAARPANVDRLLAYAAASVTTFVALGKVLSPQYLIWLVPCVALVRGRRGTAAGLLLVAAMIVTQLWFPYRYWRLALDFDSEASWLVLLRDIVLLALLASLVLPSRLAGRSASVPSLPLRPR